MHICRHPRGFVETFFLVSLLVFGTFILSKHVPSFQKEPLIDKITSQSPSISKTTLNQAVMAYQDVMASNRLTSNTLTIVDYSQPSNHKRLWVINMTTGEILHHTYVAHGKNSGLKEATRFSNQPKSYMSSLGVFMTGKPYVGQHGLSLRLHGLEPGINDNAYRRAIVMHSAHYVSESFAKQHGRLGRSHGCLVVSPHQSKAIIQDIQDGSLLFIYGATYQYRSSTTLKLT